MKTIVYSLILVLLTTFCFEVEGKKRRRRRKRRKKAPSNYARESKMLPEEREKFSEKLVYKKKYKNIYQMGAFVYTLYEDSLPNDEGETEKINFFGFGLMGRADYNENFTFFPKVTYTFFDHNKVLQTHTSSLSYGLLELDIAYRFKIKNNAWEFFVGGGPHMTYKTASFSYTEQSVSSEETRDEKEYKFGFGAAAFLLRNITKNFSFACSLKIYAMNPNTTYGGYLGALYRF
jgi:hypothetical protein